MKLDLLLEKITQLPWDVNSTEIICPELKGFNHRPHRRVANLFLRFNRISPNGIAQI